MYLATICFLLLSTQSESAPYLDPIDECILICDICFKGEQLLNCANECLFTGGEVQQHWRNHCPHFDAKIPSVQVM